MAWQAQLKEAIRADYQRGKLVAVVEFYDDVDRPNTSTMDAFEVEVGLGTPAQQRGELRKAVEERGKVIRALHDRMVVMQLQVPVDTTISIPA